MSRPLIAGWLLAAWAVGSLPAAAPAGDLAEQLDVILRAAGPGVVRIDVRRPWDTYRADSLPDFERTLAVRRIQGSGVVWGEAGHILTVADLAQPGDTLRVRGEGGAFVPAEYVGQDIDLGLSLIRVPDPTALRPIERGSPDPLQNRGWVLVLGYQTRTATKQLAVHRVRGVFRRGDFWRARIDALPDPGLAGGGVLDPGGKLIGLVLGEGSESLLLAAGAKRARVEYCMGSSGPSEAGWVLPIDQAAAVVESIRTRAIHPEGFLGVRARLPQEGNEAAQLGGVQIAQVIPGSPADRAGIRPGDQLVTFEGDSLSGWDMLTERVTRTAPGRTVRIGLVRKGQPSTVAVRLADRDHILWREKQRRIAGGRERMLRRQIEGLKQELELLRHQLAWYR